MRSGAENDVNENATTVFSQGNTEGQPHDRIEASDVLSAMPTGPLPGRDHNGDIEITAPQKMLSAMSGSLLTSLIGM